MQETFHPRIPLSRNLQLRFPHLVQQISIPFFLKKKSITMERWIVSRQDACNSHVCGLCGP
jgi:hypothetical protein